jgi:hypothetical protein
MITIVLRLLSVFINVMKKTKTGKAIPEAGHGGP